MNEYTNEQYADDVARLARLQTAAQDVVEDGITVEDAAQKHELEVDSLAAHIRLLFPSREDSDT